MTKGVTQTHLQSIWNHSEPSEVPCSSNKKLVENFFWKHGTNHWLQLYEFTVFFTTTQHNYYFFDVRKKKMYIGLSSPPPTSNYKSCNSAGPKETVGRVGLTIYFLANHNKNRKTSQLSFQGFLFKAFPPKFLMFPSPLLYIIKVVLRTFFWFCLLLYVFCVTVIQ